ncbi:MAG: hypothetical protein NO117_05135 [Sulfolobales archaeon]|nr:hypothetical protein [Sulfolobales archaeon]
MDLFTSTCQILSRRASAKAPGIDSSAFTESTLLATKELARQRMVQGFKEQDRRGDFRNDVLVVTGSLSMSAKREIETFPGGRGGGKNLLMLPLPFSKYAELFNVDIQRGVWVNPGLSSPLREVLR